MLELKGLDTVQHIIRHASEDPVLPNPRNRQVGAAAVVLLCTVLCVVSFHLQTIRKNAHHDVEYVFIVSYTILIYIVLSGLVNEIMAAKLKFKRKLRIKNVIKFVCLSILLFAGSFYQTMKLHTVLRWTSVTVRVSLLLIGMVTHTASSSNHYNIIELVDQSVQRSSISIQNKANASELETVILEYPSLLQVKYWLTIRFCLDICAVFVLYACLVHYIADAKSQRQSVVFMFGLFLIMQTTSMYTVGKFNKHIESLEFINNVNTKLMVRLLKWKPTEQVFMSSVVGMVILLVEVIFGK